MNQNRLRFIRIELQLARTFLEAARAAKNLKTRARNVANARRAHEAAKDVFAIVQCTQAQRAEIEASLDAIGNKLDVHGTAIARPIAHRRGQPWSSKNRT